MPDGEKFLVGRFFDLVAERVIGDEPVDFPLDRSDMLARPEPLLNFIYFNRF
jgi:hypothetical protein